MPNTDFEVQQLLKAYRKGIISEELFAQQIDQLVDGTDGTAVPASFLIAATKRRCSSKSSVKLRKVNQWFLPFHPDSAMTMRY